MTDPLLTVPTGWRRGEPLMQLGRPESRIEHYRPAEPDGIHIQEIALFPARKFYYFPSSLAVDSIAYVYFANTRPLNRWLAWWFAQDVNSLSTDFFTTG